MSAPVAQLEKFSAEEKLKLIAVLQKRVLARAGMFLGVIFLSMATLVYFNIYSGSNNIQENLEILNVVFVVISVICGRMLISEFMDYNKEVKSDSKKIIITRTGGRKGDKIVLGNKSFSKDEILIDSSEFDLLKGGENVRIELSAKSDTLFSLKRI